MCNSGRGSSGSGRSTGRGSSSNSSSSSTAAVVAAVVAAAVAVVAAVVAAAVAVVGFLDCICATLHHAISGEAAWEGAHLGPTGVR